MAIMKIITNLDAGTEIVLPQYTLFLVEIEYNPTTGVHLSGPTYQNIQNCEVIKEIYYPNNPGLLGSPGKMVYLMMTTAPVSSVLYWFFSGPNYDSEFSFRLTVMQHA
jgi:predicted secreted protein